MGTVIVFGTLYYQGFAKGSKHKEVIAAAFPFPTLRILCLPATVVCMNLDEKGIQPGRSQLALSPLLL
jgi:hypothetical protein